MAAQFILNLKGVKNPQHIGNKAHKLHFLIKRGFPTAPAHVCTWDAYMRYQENDNAIVETLKSELSRLDLGKRYAIRSSANIEDDLEHSFAGQFKTVLDAHGLDDILQAIWSVWATAQSPGVRTYLEKTGIDSRELKMAVIVQEMIPPVVSGVAFSKNPITGLDEIVVEAVRGSGEALVRAGVTPERWIHRWGAWTARPEPASVDIHLIQEVVNQTRQIAKAYAKPVDLEWVYDGQAINWVQLREITTLKSLNVYSNHIAREMLPGMIKPLVWSINVPLVNSQWVRLLTELIGENDIDPNSLAKAFYYRTYFNMGVLGRIFESLGLPAESLEMMMGITPPGSEKRRFNPSRQALRHMPRLLRFAADKLSFAGKVKAFAPVTRHKYLAMPIDRVGELSEQELVAKIDELYRLTQDTAYYNVVAPLLMFSYNGMLKAQLRKLGVDFASFDLMRGVDELHEYDPNLHLRRLHAHYEQLPEDAQKMISHSSYAEFRELPGIGKFQMEVEGFIRQFGHLSDSGNDFSSVPWREKPDMVLRMIIDCTSGEEKPTGKVTFQELELSSLRRSMLHPIFQRARDFRLYREQVSSLYTFGYGLFRTYFLALGDHLVRKRIILSRDDIFYLYFEEIRQIVHIGEGETDYADRVAARKREMEMYRDATVPSTIYGDQPPPLEAQMGDRLTGIATSRGYYTGPARVIQGIQEFGKLKQGDVLVIPYSDVGWAPLFTKAGAVIAESGGMLSHSSIVAREYNIPAVVSVAGACHLRDNTLVSVDGYKGEIIVHEYAADSAALEQ
jgi:pyruvate,water dikinase